MPSPPITVSAFRNSLWTRPNLAFNLSQTRYSLGLSSIVELSQAQLQQTEAQIQFASAKYQYHIAQSVLRFQIAAP